MRALLVLIVCAPAALFWLGCGGASTGNGGTTNSSAHRRVDRDDDYDNNDDDAHVLDYGQPATGMTKQALTTLIRRYYAASASEDGAAACRMLLPFLAESVAEQYGHDPGLRGRTCATVMSKLFAQRHHLLAGESATLKFVAVRVGGGHALIVLSFANLPEVRQIRALGEGTNWHIHDLLDGILE